MGMTAELNIQALLDGGYEVVDLSHRLDEDHPRLPQDRPACWTPAAEFHREGYADYVVEMQEHSGTHVDAPGHFVPGGRDVASIEAGSLVGPLCVLDVRTQCAADPDYGVAVADIRAWEARHGRIPDGAIVAMLSGWHEFYHDTERFLGTDGDGGMHFPGFSAEAVTMLAERRDAAAIAVDTLSIDPGCKTELPAHVIWLGADRWAIENAADLDKVPPSGAVGIVGLPRIARSTGFPARFLALVPKAAEGT